MTSVPILQVLYRRKGDILFGWKPLPRTTAKSYNLYSSSSSSGSYTIVKSGIPNEVDKTIYRGKVVCSVKDTDIPIPSNDYIDTVDGGGLVSGRNWYFKLTYVDTSDVESNLASADPILVRPAQIEPSFENENEVQNAHNFGWQDERFRWEKIKVDSDGRLMVDAQVDIGDITLGNVKVAARPDGTTLEYILVDDARKVIVRQDPNSIDRLADYEEHANVPANTETTILTYTNGTSYFLEKIVCSGTGDAVFRLKIGGSTIRTLRNSWNDRNVTFDYSTIARRISGGGIITVTAEHKEKASQDYEASLEGYTFAI